MRANLVPPVLAEIGTELRAVAVDPTRRERELVDALRYVRNVLAGFSQGVCNHNPNITSSATMDMVRDALAAANRALEQGD